MSGWDATHVGPLSKPAGPAAANVQGCRAKHGARLLFAAPESRSQLTEGSVDRLEGTCDEVVVGEAGVRYPAAGAATPPLEGQGGFGGCYRGRALRRRVATG